MSPFFMPYSPTQKPSSYLQRLATLTKLPSSLVNQIDSTRCNALYAIVYNLDGFLQSPATDSIERATLDVLECLNTHVDREKLAAVFKTYINPTLFPYQSGSGAMSTDGYLAASSFKKVAWLSVLFAYYRPIKREWISQLNSKTFRQFQHIDNFEHALFAWYFARNEAFALGNLVAGKAITRKIEPSLHQLTEFCEVFSFISEEQTHPESLLLAYKPIALVLESWLYELNQHLKYASTVTT